MRSSHTSTNDPARRAAGRAVRRAAAVLPALLGAAGCAVSHNYYQEDGPATTMSRVSPSAADIRDNHEPAELRQREWAARTASVESPAVVHLPAYFEDPFVDQGAQALSLSDGPDDVDFDGPQALGWEDWIAMGYCYPRFTVNWLGLPFSAVANPPWAGMESDGQLSRQVLGYDHDAERR